MTTSKLSECMSPAFYELHTQIKTQRPHTVVCKGGRGSTKSSFMSVEFILFLLQHPQCHGVVLRKIANTLRNSVYAQIQWAIGALGLYVSNESVTVFQPMNINFGIMPPLDHRVKGKRNKNAELSQRSLAIIDGLREEVLA